MSTIGIMDHRCRRRRGEKLVKVFFELTPDPEVEGWPPVGVESVWARDLGKGRYELRNTPWYAPGVSFGDVVAVRRDQESGILNYEKTIMGAGHSTMRVALAKHHLVNREELFASLKRLGCSYEGMGDGPTDMIGIDIPPEIPLAPVRAFLAAGQEADKWFYEESWLEHPNEEDAA